MLRNNCLAYWPFWINQANSGGTQYDMAILKKA